MAKWKYVGLEKIPDVWGAEKAGMCLTHEL